MFSSEAWLANPGGGFYNGVATQSVRFNLADDANLNEDFSGAGNRKLWTFSTWFKRTNLVDGTLFAAYASASVRDCIRVLSNVINFQLADGSETYNANSTALLRDTSAWYHLVVQFNSADSTETNRTKMWINGLPITLAESGDGIAAQNVSSSFGNDKYHTIGARRTSGTDNNLEFDGYMADTHYVNGAALDYTSFAEFKNGVLIPKAYSGSYGTNGFYFKYDQVGVGTASTSTIGADISGNTNHFTSSNLVASDCAMPDSPENNFSTWNALFRGGEQSASIAATSTLLNGNLEVSVPTNSYMGNTFRPVSGKWYCEFRLKTLGDARGEVDWGWFQATTYAGTTAHAGQANKWGAYYHAYSTAHIQVSDETTQLGSNINLTLSAGSVLQLAWDIDNNKGWLGIDNTYYAADNGTDGNPSTGANQTFTFTADEAQNLQCYVGNGLSTDVFVANFGQDSTFGGDETATSNADANGIGAFHHAPPSDYLSLCTANLPEPTIGPNSDTQATDHFSSVLFTGGSGDVNVAVPFKPDWVWMKARSNAQGHSIADSSRGGTKLLQSNSSGAENSVNSGNDVNEIHFTSDGFTSNTDWHTNNYTYVAWNWKANGATTTTNDASSTSVGTIDSVFQANTTAGFSIVTFAADNTAGRVVAHGLGVAPKMIITKGRAQTTGWYTYHFNIGANKFIRLNEVNPEATNTGIWGNTHPTSSVFTIGNNECGYNTGGANDVLAYCFAEIEGYSKFGSFVGNASDNGVFVFLGFKPSFIMLKSASATSAFTSWVIYDNKRKTFNDDVGDNSNPLYANKNAPEGERGNGTTDLSGNANAIDFLSNGFKLRDNADEINATETFVYMAFGETFKYANAE